MNLANCLYVSCNVITIVGQNIAINIYQLYAVFRRPLSLKAWVWGRTLAGIAGSNPDGGFDIRHLRILCKGRGLCDQPIPRPEEPAVSLSINWQYLTRRVNSVPCQLSSCG
jgi:hypothetical protein